ncbi:thioredoxin family protein [Spirulina subsalsa]|uniref:thioredoxin family protein n=1 Tax=Spirulina subsalsa TaxID=54311 RepID=UPI000311C8CB|nr:thioredoxin family protein [Spirulina subsalsa]
MAKRTVQILGTGCKKCQQLETNVKEAIALLNWDAEVLHITDPLQIAERGVMKTPALIVDGQVMSQGKVATPEQLQTLLEAQPS